MSYAEIIAQFASNFNNAWVLVEVNEGSGGVVVSTLTDGLHLKNVLYTESRGRAGFSLSVDRGKAAHAGVKMSKSVKSVGCRYMKTIVESDKLILNDYDILMELASFVRKGDTYKAEDNSHDDLSMCLVLFGWLSQQSEWKYLTGVDVTRSSKDMTGGLADTEVPFIIAGRSDSDGYTSLNGDDAEEVYVGHFTDGNMKIPVYGDDGDDFNFGGGGY